MSVRAVNLVEVARIPKAKASERADDPLESCLALVQGVQVDLGDDGPRFRKGILSPGDDTIFVPLDVELYQGVGLELQAT